MTSYLPKAAHVPQPITSLEPWVTPDIAKLVAAMDQSWMANREKWPTHLLEVAQ
jgi:hypothetical protein